MAAVLGFESTLKRLLSSRDDKLVDPPQLDEIAPGELMLLVAGAASPAERVRIMARRIGIDSLALAERRSLLKELTERCAECRTKLACAFWLAEHEREDAFREILSQCRGIRRIASLRPLRRPASSWGACL